jgi:hypothetical protein
MLQLPTRFVHWAFVVHAILESKLHEPASGVQVAAVVHAAPLVWLLEQVLPRLQSLFALHVVVLGSPAVHLPATPAQVVA